MADEAAPVAEPAAPAAEPAAPVAAEKPDRSDRSGKETFAERLERLGWDKKTPHGDNPEALGAKARAAAGGDDEHQEDTKPDIPKPKPSEPAKPADPTDRAARLEKLKADVTELGMVIEDGKVTVAERHALREERRQAKAEIAKLEQEAKVRTDAMLASIEEREAKLKPGLGKLEQFERAVADDDHEALAKLMGFEDYDKWQEHIIGVKSDPNYKTLRSLKETVERDKREREEREVAAAREAEEAAARTEQEERTKKQREIDTGYCRDLSAQMKEHSDPLIKAMADDPGFVNAVFRVQKENWDGDKPMPVEVAIRTPARGAGLPLMAELKRLHDKLAPVFGSPQPSPSVAVAAVKAGVGKPAPEPEKKKTRTPEPTKAPAVSERKQSDQEWKQSAARRLEEAAREEAAARKRKTA